MTGINEILEFIFDHKSDPRISISKKLKYGFKHFYISFTIDEEPDKNSNGNSSYLRYRDSLEICIDNRNKCIEFLSGGGENNILIEDDKLVERWSNKLDDYLNQNLESKVKSLFELTLSTCYNKNLFREYQMKKIFPEDESI